MKKYTILFALLLFAGMVRGQDKDTIEVQKIGNKFFIVLDKAKSDSAIAAAVKAATAPRNFDSHFMVVGLTTFGFVNTWNKTTSTAMPTSKSVTNTFGTDPQFELSPMFLWRHSDNLLIEFEPSFDGTNLGVNWADVTYFAHPGVILRGGYIVLPFGTYNKRLAAGWIDKLATDPVGVTSSPVTSDWGIEMEGGLPCGNMKVNYDVSLTNGFQLLQDGTIQNPGITDNNLGKTVTGRFGWLPLKNSGLEIGVSGLYGKAADAGDSAHKNAATYMSAVDLQYVYSGTHVIFNLKAQYNMQYITSENYINPGDSAEMYTFTNFSQGYYGQISVRPVSANKVIRSLEFAVRYSGYDNPKGAGWENHTKQTSAGIDYWLNWRTVVKITYENLITSNPDNENVGLVNQKNMQNMLFAQFSVQF